MSFKPVYYSQQDPQWKDEILGFGEPVDSIGYVGSALTSTSMLLSGHGFIETPRSLNEQLRQVDGFIGAGIRWDALCSIHPQVILKSNVSCVNTDAPLSQINASIAAGQPVIVMVDSAPAAGLLTHWVVLYGMEGDDYLMLDPWPHRTSVRKKTLLVPRYSQGKPLRRSIMHAVILECFPVGGSAAADDTFTSRGTVSRTQAKTRTPSSRGSHARVRGDLTRGLDIYSNLERSKPAAVVVTVPPDTLLTILEIEGAAKVGAVNQFIRIRAPQGEEGFAAAWYLERAELAGPAPAAPAPSRTREAATASTPRTAAASPGRGLKLTVVVKSSGTKVYKSPSIRSEVLSKEKAGVKLAVVETVEEAIKKIGLGGKWLSVKSTNGKQGFVDAGSVKEG